METLQEMRKPCSDGKPDRSDFSLRNFLAHMYVLAKRYGGAWTQLLLGCAAKVPDSYDELMTQSQS